MATIEEIWKKYDEMEHRLSSPLSQRMLDMAELSSGHRVLDIATGRGEPAVPAAHRVGPTGSVLGIDVSATMLEMASARALSEGIENLRVNVGNAETLDGVPSSSFDAVLARWCLMYFERPLMALQSMRRTIDPNGVLVVAVWAEPERVHYYSFPRKVLEEFCSIPPIDAYAPGTFAYASVDRIRDDFANAGFTIDAIEEMVVDVMHVATGEELVEWTRCFGMGRLLQNLPEETQRAWEERLISRADAFRRFDGYRLGGVTRLICARPQN